VACANSHSLHSLQENRVLSEPDPFRHSPYRAIVDHPPFAWPGDARIAVWIIPNIEHFHIELGPGAPDVRNHSRRDRCNTSPDTTRSGSPPARRSSMPIARAQAHDTGLQSAQHFGKVVIRLG
jgi:hypothetical protein